MPEETKEEVEPLVVYDFTIDPDRALYGQWRFGWWTTGVSPDKVYGQATLVKVL